MAHGVTHEPLQLLNGCGGARAFDAGAARDAGKVEVVRGRGRRFAAGGFILMIIPADMNEVLRLMQPDGGQRAEIHPERAVAVEDKHLAPGQGDSQTKSD